MSFNVNKAICLIIGTMIQEPGVVPQVLAKIKPDDILDHLLQSIFNAVVDLTSRNAIADKLSIEYIIRHELEDKQWNYIISQASVEKLDTYTGLVFDYCLKRKLSGIASQYAGDNNRGSESGTDMLIRLNGQIDALMGSSVSSDSSASYADLVTDFMDRYTELATSGIGMAGKSSGYRDLDELLSGVCPGLIVLAARPSMGKTTLAMNIGENFAARGDRVMVFSMEMPKHELFKKSVSAYGSGLDYQKIRNGTLSELELAQLENSVSAVRNYSIVIDDQQGLTATDVRMRAIKEHRKSPLSMIMVDYLQLMNFSDCNSDSKTDQVGHASRMLKSLSTELGIPVIALSQLNRGVEQRADKRPMNSDLRESGAIEQDADVIMFVYRDEYYNQDSPDKGLAEIIIGKQRNGSLGTVMMKFVGKHSRFEPINGVAKRQEY